MKKVILVFFLFVGIIGNVSSITQEDAEPVYVSGFLHAFALWMLADEGGYSLDTAVDSPNIEDRSFQLFVDLYLESSDTDEDWLSELCQTLLREYFVKGTLPDSSEETQEEPVSDESPVQALEIVSWRWANEHDMITIEGVVRNNSERTYEGVQIYITAEDASGDFLGTGWTYLRPTTLPPNSTSIFNVYINHAQCLTNQLMISYRFSE